MNKVINDIALERARQVNEEGWSYEHDDKHNEGQMAWAAAAYAIEASRYDLDRGTPELAQMLRTMRPYHWPWSESWWKPKNQRHDLVRAAALIVAEIERIDRQSVTKVDDRPFPVITRNAGEQCPAFVRWDSLNEEWAQKNHSQSLEELARRGGLDPTEVVANVEKRAWRNMGMAEAVRRILPLAIHRRAGETSGDRNG